MMYESQSCTDFLSILRYKNNHVAPTELEDILQRHPAVQECLVFGKPDDQVQELISAVVVVKPGQKVKWSSFHLILSLFINLHFFSWQVSEEELRNFVNKEVTDFKKIRGDVLFRDQIPRNSVGKLIRREMREWARNQVKCKEHNHAKMQSIHSRVADRWTELELILRFP